MVVESVALRSRSSESSPAAVSAALARFGRVRVHFEVSNSGRPAGFGYAEFESAAAAAAASGAAGLAVDGRELRVAPYTAQSNFRNADGSRRKEKKKKSKSAAPA
jgi:RNA recognition motif-containing protein